MQSSDSRTNPTGFATSGAASSAATTGAVTATSPWKASPVLFVAALGLALFLSSMWTARADTSGVSTAVVYATRFVSLGTCLYMAWTFRNHLPQVNLVLATACISMVIHLACVLVAPQLSLGADVSLVVDYLSGAFEGVANALMTLLFAHVLSTFHPTRSAVGIGVAYLLVDTGILFLDTLSVEAIHYARPVFTLLSVVILVACCRALMFVGARPGAKVGAGAEPGAKVGAGAASDHGLQYGMARKEGEEERPLAFFSTHTDWLLLLIVAMLFPNLFGVIAQVSSETGGNFALYDIPAEIVMIAMQALFLIFMATFGSRFGFSTILAFIIPLYATGFALFPSNWSSDNPLAGCLIRAGYVIIAILLWALMARKSYDDPRHTYLYFGIYCGVSDAQIGRLTGSVLMGDNGPSLALCQGISLASLWAICIFGLVMFFLLQRGSSAARVGSFEPLGQTDAGAAGAGTGVEAGSGARVAAGGSAVSNETTGAPSSSATPGVDTFAAQFEALAERVHLTQREREVLAEAIHGYSRTNIGKKLSLSPETVKTYMNRAYAKAQVTSKQELIARIEDEPLP